MFKDIRTTLKNSILYAFGNIANKLAGFLLLPIYSSYFSISEYGLLAIFEISSDFIIAISSLGLDHGLRRWYWDKDINCSKKTLFFTYYSFSILSTVAVCVLSFLIMSNYSLSIFSLNVSKKLILIFCINLLLKVMVTKLLLLMRNQQKAFDQTKFLMSYLFISLFITIILIVVFHLGIISIFISQSISFTILFLFLLPYLLQNIELSFNKKLFTEMLRFSLPLALSGIFSLVLTLGDRFIIKHFLALADVGNYSIAYKISSITRLLIVTSFNQAFSYVFYRQMFTEKNRRFFSKIFSYYSMVAIYFALFLSIFGGEIIKLITTNEDYHHSINLVPILCLGVVIGGSRQILTLTLTKHKKTILIASFLMISALLNIGLNIIFIPVMGNKGAAYSTLFSQFFLMMIFGYFTIRIESIKFEFKRILFAYILGIFLYLVIDSLLLGNIYLNILLKLLLWLSYPMYFYIFKLYEPIELKRVKGFWTKWKNPGNWKHNLKNIKFD